MPPEIQTQISSINGEKAMRMAEIERKRSELRRRMEEASKARQKAKKSFMTPERKKKLRLLLRKKAAEELKKEQERKAEERKWTIEERCGEPEDIQWSGKEELIDVCEYYYQRILEIESEKWDIELEIRRQHSEIVDINSKVNDLRGKFQKPILKKVSKFGNKFAQLQRKAAEYNFRNQLKLVRRHEYTLKEDDKKNQHADKNPENNEIKETEVEEQKNEEPSKVDEETRVHEDLPAEGDLEGRLEAGEELLVEPTESAEKECHLESSKFASEGEDDHLEIRDGTSDLQTSLEYEEGLPDSELRLEDGTEAVSHGEEGIHLELEAENNEEFRLKEEVAENEESRLDLPEFSEEQVQPPESPPSIHTEEDLWLYLKDNVSAVHPSTVEEFVQNLIGTLQHVPEEYLKPVIEANIRRVKTPSVTDGEHLTTPVDEEANNEEPREGDNLNSVESQDTSEGIFTSAKEEVLSQFPGVSSALEAAD